jgi:hypothetical protein
MSSRVPLSKCQDSSPPLLLAVHTEVQLAEVKVEMWRSEVSCTLSLHHRGEVTFWGVGEGVRETLTNLQPTPTPLISLASHGVGRRAGQVRGMADVGIKTRSQPKIYIKRTVHLRMQWLS